MEQMTRWILRHRRLVVIAWLVLTVVGIATVSSATKAMDQKFSVPGREGWETNAQIAQIYNHTGSDTSPLLPVVTLPAGKSASDPAIRGDLRGLEQRTQRAVPGARVAGYGSTGSRAFLSKDGRTAFVVAYPPADPNATFGGNPDAEKHLRAALKGVTIAGPAVHLTG
jgi:putative drug exporter of the RND superfamily